jgi:hypothetical protein
MQSKNPESFKSYSILQYSNAAILHFLDLRRYFVADSRYRFFGIFPITESTEAKISFTGGAKA